MSSTPQFDYKELDKEGFETLDAIAGADKFNEWMYKTILPYCSGSVLEVGSGIGNISKHFLKNNFEITLSDIRNNYCEVLQKNYKNYSNLKGVFNLDLVNPDFQNAYGNFINSFDTVFALNVVEHIENDQLAVSNCCKMLKSGGKLIILVPAFNSLYNRFDEELCHYRRYTASTLKKLFLNANYKILRTFYFNAAGILGWYFSGKLQSNKIIPKGQMSLYNSLVPLFKIGDAVLLNKIGLSVICVGEKN